MCAHVPLPGVFICGTAVFICGTGVFICGTGVFICGTGVFIRGTGVLIRGTGVLICGTTPPGRPSVLCCRHGYGPSVLCCALSTVLPPRVPRARARGPRQPENVASFVGLGAE